MEESKKIDGNKRQPIKGSKQIVLFLLILLAVGIYGNLNPYYKIPVFHAANILLTFFILIFLTILEFLIKLFDE